MQNLNFFIASDEVRAKRRQLELESLGEKKSLVNLMYEIKKEISLTLSVDTHH